jgi:predicted transposase YdaD
MQLTNPFIELGIQRGIKKGRQEGRQAGEVELVLRQLKRRLGNLAAPQAKAIRQLDLSQIEALGEALLEFTSKADLARWLQKFAAR